MGKKIKHVLLFITIFLFIFLLPYNGVYAEEETINGKTYSYTTTDDGSNAVSLESVKFKLTCYGDGAGGSSFFCGLSSANLAGYDEKYGWGYFEIDGERYVAMAGALHDYISSGEWSSILGVGASGRKYNHVYYFNTGYNTPLDQCEKFQFKFENQEFDSNVYNGVIVDTGPAMMLPQAYSFYNDVENCNAIDVYMGANGESIGESSPISGQVIVATSNGSFSSNKSSQNEDLGFIEWLMDIFAKYIHIPIGDSIQKIIDEVGADLTEEEAKNILYTKQSIKSLSNPFNKEILIEDANSKKEITAINTQNIPNQIQNKDGETEEVFTPTTLVPAIPMDVYTMTTTNVKLFDIDFLNNNNNNDNKFWIKYRNLVNTASHIAMYLCAALLIGMLIWRSIVYILSIYNDKTESAKKSIKIMDNFAKAVALLVGIYLFSTLMIYFYNYLTSIISGGFLTRFPIRFIVKDVYSFNTNIISGIRYQTLSSRIIGEYVWSWVYLGMSILNGIYFMFMFMRMIVIGLLIIIAPITAITTMQNTLQNEATTSGLFHINGWIKAFLGVLWLPFIVTIVMGLFLRI